MITLEGKGVSGGYASGRIAFFHRDVAEVEKRAVDDAEAEVERFLKAKEVASEQVRLLYEKAVTDVGQEEANIFDIHQMMLDDEDYLEAIQGLIIDQQVNAEYAVATTAEEFADMFSSMDDEYMQGRAADVRDISSRLVRVLRGGGEGGFNPSEPVILAADDLVPSETLQFDRTRILAIVTMYGSSTSHTAILARMMNIPAVIGLGENLTPDVDGREAIVDGFTGTLLVEPVAAARDHYDGKFREEQTRRTTLRQLRGKGNITRDGRKIDLYANIGGVEDVNEALENDAGGIGLFRSEFLYLQQDDYPSEDVQFAAYKAVAEGMAGRRVIIRTLDIGADKQIGYFGLDHEENPALGFRAIRICLERPDLFRTQLRALYRASAFGRVAIMFPMITDVEEVREIKTIIAEVRDDLNRQGIAMAERVEIGVMIETPAAVMVSDLLAKEVDFFSVGTNDLTQYVLAVDRQNPKLDRFYRPHHTGLLRMLKMVVDNAHLEGKWVGICGELAADLELTEFFLSIGVDELSVSPGSLLAVRQKIRSIDTSTLTHFPL